MRFLRLIIKGLNIISEDGFLQFLREFKKFMIRYIIPGGLRDLIYIRNLKLQLRQRPEFTSSFDLVFASKNELDDLSDKYGTDKGGTYAPVSWDTHSYTPIYDLIFGHLDPNIVLECGIGTNNPDNLSTMGVDYSPGASLRMWKEYFPDSLIIGLDIDEEILFQEGRIETYQVDQTSETSINKFVSHFGEEFRIDIVIDDGLHTGEAALTLLNELFDFVETGGLYIIEDLKIDYVLEVLTALEEDYNVASVHVMTNRQDSLIVIRK